jgi:hypothetical protein
VEKAARESLRQDNWSIPCLLSLTVSCLRICIVSMTSSLYHPFHRCNCFRDPWQKDLFLFSDWGPECCLTSDWPKAIRDPVLTAESNGRWWNSSFPLLSWLESHWHDGVHRARSWSPEIQAEFNITFNECLHGEDGYVQWSCTHHSFNPLPVRDFLFHIKLRRHFLVSTGKSKALTTLTQNNLSRP